MLIFSYLWTEDKATKRIKEINSKSKEVIGTTFSDEFERHFISLETSKPLPTLDLDFDDFKDFSFQKYKDVNIHSMDIYFNGTNLSGLEVIYIVDESSI